MYYNILLRSFFLLCIFIGSTSAMGQTADSNNKKDSSMKTYLIERDIPGAGHLTAAELKGISQKSCGVLKEMGAKIKWLQSYVTGDKVYCVYQAQNENLLREHAQKGGFPITNITEIANIINPATAEL